MNNYYTLFLEAINNCLEKCIDKTFVDSKSMLFSLTRGGIYKQGYIAACNDMKEYADNLIGLYRLHTDNVSQLNGEDKYAKGTKSK